MPPDAKTLAEPLLPPLQEMFVALLFVAAKGSAACAVAGKKSAFSTSKAMAIAKVNSDRK